MVLTLEEFVRQIAAPLIVALIAWLLKDIVVGLYRARQEEARKEWLFQLRDVYCPLHFWSAVVLFRGSPGKDKFGVAELSVVLAKAVTLLPAKQYFVFVKILEEATGQATARAPKGDILKARDFVYSRIEALNFVLFKIPAHFNLQSVADPFAPLRSMWRLVMAALVPLLIWVILFVALAGSYLVLSENLMAMVFLCVLGMLLTIQEIVQRKRRYQNLKDRISL